ncbi:MAG: SurA N-terminal domain-containing protein [Candidatus Aminicenantales bacterium]
MKKIAIFFIFLFAFTHLFGGEEVVEEIVAIVNQDIITRSDYENQLRNIYQILRSQYKGEEFQKQFTQAKNRLLESMIRETLLLQEAKKRGIDVSEQVRLNIEDIKKQYGLQSDEHLRRELAKQGLTLEEWKRQFEEMLLKQAVIYQEVDSKIALDDSEIVSYYKSHSEEFIEPEEYKLRAIYLSSSGKTQEELESKKEEILSHLEKGEDMAQLASKYSEGPEKDSQGDLGSFKKGELAKNLQQEVEKLEPGEHTAWIDIANGCYLLKLEEKKEKRLKPFEEVREEIENKLFMERKRKKEEEFFKKLTESNFVKILIPVPEEAKIEKQ